MNDIMKPCAIGLCIIYLVLFLVLPVCAIGYGINYQSGDILWSTENQAGYDLIEYSGITLPIYAFLTMCVCIWVLPGKKAAIVCLVGAIMPLISYLFVHNKVDNFSTHIRIGGGIIAAMLCGIGAAVLCWLSDQGPRRDTTPGVGRGNGNEW